MSFYKISPKNGLDEENLINGRQNNYAWSIEELGDYIYVGTGRNVPYNIIKIDPNVNTPDLITPEQLDNSPEIWRYKKNSLKGWQLVHKADIQSTISGYRYIVGHNPYNGMKCLYAASYGGNVEILKSTNGVNWFKVQEGAIQGTSSRAMVSHNGKIYVGAIDETSISDITLLYSSTDPEFFPFDLVIDSGKPGFDPDKNPKGQISNMVVFNNKLYVATSSLKGVALYRTEGCEPEMNKWVKIAENGFDCPLNTYSLSIGVFKEHVYLSMTKILPISWLLPIGCEIVRVDKKDRWEVIVGGSIFDDDECCCNSRCKHHYGPGFNNPFNVYAWQIEEYKGRLFVTTFDDAINMELILNTLLANKEELIGMIGDKFTNLLIDLYMLIVKELNRLKYPFGFNMYMSEDGVSFKPVCVNGFDNGKNYGGRLLFVDSCNSLYVGTANPYEGCEMWVTNEIPRCFARDFDFTSILCSKEYKMIMENKDEIMEKLKIVTNKMKK
ncbi:MAG: hypothetical protein RR898_07235 [Clostridium sp.]|uniref:hypothetical protein n=1 Tax=Clostridium sp. TaxID=1506 RepID=UPI002FCB80A4